MDLRSVLNTSDNGDHAPVKAPPTPQKPQQLPQQRQSHPSQSPAQYGYREYGQHPPPQPSPGKPIAQDYPHHLHTQHLQQQPPAAAYLPPSPYQAPRPFPGRPAPPPLQPANYHDARSPGGSMPAPSPYRSVTTPSTASGGSGYPFPPAQSPAEASSPVQRHQYPPAQQYQHQHQHQNQLQRRDSYAQGPPTHPAGPYMQQQHPVPQTPPVVTPGASHQYLHQRSQSTHSTPTPTSAQSQHQYGPPYVQGSPVAAPRPPPIEYNRQPSLPSQPPTPVGPPLSAAGSRHPSAPGSYPQPPSPYQQRMTSAQVVQTQASPHPPPPLAKRVSSSYESSAAEFHRRSQSQAQSEREHSFSVSPKTRIPSLPSVQDHSTPASVEPERRPSLAVQNMVIDTDRGTTPAKRKLEDRDLSLSELEHNEARPPPGEVNGDHVPSETPNPRPSSSSSAMPRKKRSRYAQPPVWAQSADVLGRKMPNNANFVLQKRVHSHINGRPDAPPPARTARTSRHASPEASRSQHSNSAPAQPPTTAEPPVQDSLGPWEPSILGVRPYEEMAKILADFLYVHVVKCPDMQEISSRGIQFEIEAKLGTLIDKDTNHRVERYLDSECILHDNNRVAFKSSMTEAQHKYFNDFLNQKVVETDPRHPEARHRVQLLYKHRRQIDRFFELPANLHGHIPGCVRARLGSRNKNVRVRVTYDQKSHEVLAKIIKARVADINLHFPLCPMDCRVSINLEMNWDGPVEELEQYAVGQSEKHPDRNKDRLSYTHGHYQIDLTQVTQTLSGPGGAPRPEKEHELEIELAPGILIDQGRRALSGAPHRYQELVEGFIDNVRVLARKAQDHS